MVRSTTVVNPSELEQVPHTVSVVIPVYGGEKTLAGIVSEIETLTVATRTPDGYDLVVKEVLLVYDNGNDDSPRVIHELSERYAFVRPIWLSRNFGQHAATLAGMASSGSEWIVTVDEDGQHDPRYILAMLDTAMREGAGLVYAKPTNPAPHGVVRNAASKSAKWLLTKIFGNVNAPDYQSFRLMLGSVGRSVAAYAGSGVYLDVALGWIVGRSATCPVTLRGEGDQRQSGYSRRRLLSHFWRMVLSNGTRGLRIVSLIGVIFAAFGVGLTAVILVSHFIGDNTPAGWGSTIVVVSLSSGAVLFSLGIIAEYIGVSVNMAMGKPPYLITSDPANGPLGRRHGSPLQ
ncbi:MAG: polyisoprenyl-phosphate glycosyltransferase [Microbacteriaceae bacterium]|nr:polyisoprenyl-phosphate glycosyltransferase [Microbacteriaceae bacterium]